MPSRTPSPLPVAGRQPPERADAVRNRLKILDAAARLVERHGIEHVSMDMLAEEAGVGKGTIFRRFGDRAGVALAMLDEHERRFQEGFMRGAPPLGPGAPPGERLQAFGHALIDLLETNGDLILAGQTGSPCARFRSPPYRVYRAHVTSLLAELDPRLDAEYHADSLLAVLAADQYRHLRREREMPIERVRAGWESVVAAVEALAGVTGRGDDLYSLPADLPVPEDDGAADGLRGSRPAGVALPATDGSEVVLAELPGRTVVFAYPRTGTPGEESPGGNEAWDAIPGARGCTPQACAIRDEHARFEALGVRVFGLSTQTTEDQREAVERLHLPYPLLSDERNTLGLPTFEAGGLTLHRRLTLILTDGVVEDLVYPVFPPDRAAEQALARL